MQSSKYVFLLFLIVTLLASDPTQQRRALNTSINGPTGLAINGGQLYVIEGETEKVLQIDLTNGTLSSAAGTGSTANTDCVPRQNIAATKACLKYPEALAVNSEGDLFIGDIEGVVRKVDAHTGIISKVYANRSKIPMQISALAFDNNGNLLIAEVTEISELNVQTGIAKLIVGGLHDGYSSDTEPSGSAQLRYISGVAVDKDNNVIITDHENCRILRIDRTANKISTLAITANANAGGYCGRGIVGPVRTPSDSVIDADGNIYFLEGAYDVVLRLDARTHAFTTVAGTEVRGYAGDGGLAPKALLGNPSGLAIDAEGNLYISEYVNNRIRRVDAKTGIITTIAGNGLPHRIDIQM